MGFELLQNVEVWFLHRQQEQRTQGRGGCGSRCMGGGSRGCLETTERESGHGRGTLFSKGRQNNTGQSKRLVN